jgi:Bacterial membrane protein YfhO
MLESIAPPYAIWWALATYVACTLLLGYPALHGGFLVTPISDQYIGGFAVRNFAATSLKAGHGIPQWDPYLFGGMPYVASMNGDMFYPTFLLRAILPTDVAMTWSFMIHSVLAGLFTYIFARALGFSFAASLIGGLAYMMSGPITGLVSPGHDGKLYISALTPLMLFFLLRGVRDGRMWAWGGLAVVTGLGVLTPHPQLLQYMLLLAGAFALYLAFGSWNGVVLPRGVAVRRLGFAAVAVGLGFLMGAVQYAPVLHYVQWSPRAGGKDYATAVSYSMPPEELLNSIVPQFSGILDNYWGRNSIHFHSDYGGVIVVLLAGLGLAAVPPRGWARGFRWFWIGTFAVSLLWALGGFTPFYQLIYAIVPGTKFFRAPSTIMYVTMFSVAMFATMGVERALLAAETISTRFIVGWAVGIIAFALILLAGLPQAIAGMIARGFTVGAAPDQIEQYVQIFRSRAQANQPALLVGVLRSILVVAVGLSFLSMLRQGRVTRRMAAIGLGLLLVVDLWSIERLYWRFSPPASVMYASDPAVDAVRRDSVPSRVMTWDPLGVSNESRDATFHGDALMVHQLRLVAGYHGNELGRYQQLLDAAQLGDPRAPCYCSPAFWRQENVRYLYTTLPESLATSVASQLHLAQGFQKVLGPVKNASGTNVYLYRVPGDNPPAWVASAMVKGTDDQALGTVLDARFEPGRAAIVDTAAAVQAAALTQVPAASSIVARVTSYAPGRIDISLSQPASQGSALIVSENFYPGWRAQIDGRDAQTVRANYNLIGIPLAAGARQVQLRFMDGSYNTGKTITLLAIALAVAVVIAGVVIDRRASAPATVAA